MPLIRALKNMDYSGINLITHVADLYTKNYKQCSEKFKDLKKRRARTCLRLRIPKIVNLSILRKLIYGFNKTTIKSLQVVFFCLFFVFFNKLTG